MNLARLIEETEICRLDSFFVYYKRVSAAVASCSVGAEAAAVAADAAAGIGEDWPRGGLWSPGG